MDCVIILGERGKEFKLVNDSSLINLKKIMKPTIIIKNNKEYQLYRVNNINKIMIKGDYIFKKDTLNILTDKRKDIVLESDIQNDIIQKLKDLGLNPIPEVRCRYGRIDILTDHSIIEIKKAIGYKHALGQILFYHKVYPNKNMIIYLFEIENLNIKEIKEIYQEYNVKLITI